MFKKIRTILAIVGLVTIFVVVREVKSSSSGIIQIGTVTIPKFDLSLDLKEFKNKFGFIDINNIDDLQKVIDSISSLDYSTLVSDPNEALNLGEGNCQAYSLMFDKILDYNKIESEIVIDGEHTYNKFTFNNKTYLLDFSNKSLKEVF